MSQSSSCPNCSAELERLAGGGVRCPAAGCGYAMTASAPAAGEPPRNRRQVELLSRNWELLEEIGAGGMGRVFKAKQRTLGRMVILKLLHARLAGRTAVRERFLREARLTAQITHPNIVRVIAVEEEAGAIAYELLDGENLRSLVEREGPLPAPRALALAGMAAQGLAQAHRQGVIHRDLKPDNLLLDREGVLKVIDFGLARGDDSAKTTAGVVLGTLAYMAPEQARGEVVGPAADIYGLGATLYELLSASPPFVAATREAIHMAVLGGAPRPLAETRPGLPAEAVAIVERAMERVPADRYPSMAAMCVAIRAALPEQAGRSSSARHRAARGSLSQAIPLPPKPPPPARRRVTAAGLVALAAVLVSAGVALRTTDSALAPATQPSPLANEVPRGLSLVSVPGRAVVSWSGAPGLVASWRTAEAGPGALRLGPPLGRTGKDPVALGTAAGASPWTPGRRTSVPGGTTERWVLEPLSPGNRHECRLTSLDSTEPVTLVVIETPGEDAWRGEIQRLLGSGTNPRDWDRAKEELRLVPPVPPLPEVASLAGLLGELAAWPRDQARRDADSRTLARFLRQLAAHPPAPEQACAALARQLAGPPPHRSNSELLLSLLGRLLQGDLAPFRNALAREVAQRRLPPAMALLYEAGALRAAGRFQDAVALAEAAVKREPETMEPYAFLLEMGLLPSIPAVVRGAFDSHPMVWVPPGSVRRGSDTDTPEEAPARTVEVSGFFIDRTPVTNAEYRLFQAWAARTGDHGRCDRAEPAGYAHQSMYDITATLNPLDDGKREPDMPAASLSWYDASAYAGWVGRRLPTEAEWQRAARGGDQRRFPWGDEAPDRSRANFGDPKGTVVPVFTPGSGPGKRPAFAAGVSPFGVYSMVGNVSHWILDTFEARGYAESRDLDPVFEGPAPTRVSLGSSYMDGPNELRVSRRMSVAPGERWGSMSFRTVRAIRPYTGAPPLQPVTVAALAPRREGAMLDLRQPGWAGGFAALGNRVHLFHGHRLVGRSWRDSADGGATWSPRRAWPCPVVAPHFSVASWRKALWLVGFAEAPDRWIRVSRGTPDAREWSPPIEIQTGTRPEIPGIVAHAAGLDVYTLQGTSLGRFEVPVEGGKPSFESVGEFDIHAESFGAARCRDGSSHVLGRASMPGRHLVHGRRDGRGWRFRPLLERPTEGRAVRLAAAGDSLYASFVDTDAGRKGGPLRFVRSVNAGLDWEEPVRELGAAASLASDAYTCDLIADGETVVLTWQADYQPGTMLLGPTVLASFDRGRSFSRRVGLGVAPEGKVLGPRLLLSEAGLGLFVFWGGMVDSYLFARPAPFLPSGWKFAGDGTCAR